MILLGLAVLLLFRQDQADTLGPAGMMVGMGTAGVIGWRRSAWLESRERRAWRVMAIGLFSAATGVFVTGLLVMGGVILPAFGPIDAFFVLTYLSLVIAIWLLARAATVGRGWMITLLDAFIGGVALAGLLWSVLEESLREHIGSASGWELALAALYPVIDVIAVIALMILVLRRSYFRMDIRLVFIALTLGFQLVGDLSFFQQGLGSTFQDADPLYPLFLLSAVCSLLASAVVDRTPRLREYPERSTPLLALMWPYAMVAALLVSHVIRYHEITGGRAVVLDALVLIMVLVLVRQLVVIQGHRNQIEMQRSELVASVSHELRTPLTAIVGYLSLLEEDAESIPEDLRDEMLADVSGQAKHMARLVSDLMLLAKGFDRRVPLHIGKTTVSEVVRQALSGLPSSTVSVEIPEDCVIRVDSDRIRQALVNMITNAEKYGGGQTLVRAVVRHERTLVIEVHDDGAGVPTKYENLIWERFERGAKRLDATTPGMGIGLAILRAVAESHGGSAAYRRSELLGGSCFILTIPGCVSARQVRMRADDQTREPLSRVARARPRAR